MDDKYKRILVELLERITVSRELADVNIAAGIALQERLSLSAARCRSALAGQARGRLVAVAFC